ncbi:MAG: molybdopterin-dependent oxidoreductase [Acidobacteriaceae bacterium]|nr:molybdopterin-dependent oxidoreductase [Acidobacteriaceae bacterium]
MREHPGARAVDRRGFLRSLGGGLVVLLAVDDLAPSQESGRGEGHERPQDIAAWLQIAPDGSITGFTGKVEVGQNIRTSLTQAIADELRCQPGSVRLVMGDTDLCPWDMGTFGSRTTPTMAPEMRKMASTARETLIDKAAELWAVPQTQIHMTGGWLRAGQKKASCGEIAGRINWTVITGVSDHITAPNDWRIAGASVPKVNGRKIVTGKHAYASDGAPPACFTAVYFDRRASAPGFSRPTRAVQRRCQGSLWCAMATLSAWPPWTS